MAVIPDLVPSVASTVLPDGVRVERKGVSKWRRLRATLSWPTTIPRLEIPASPASRARHSHFCLWVAVALSSTPFSPLFLTQYQAGVLMALLDLKPRWKPPLLTIAHISYPIFDQPHAASW